MKRLFASILAILLAASLSVTAFAKNILTLDITIEEPVHNQPFPTTATVPADALYYVKELKWEGTGGLDVATNNSTYDVYITLCVKNKNDIFKIQKGGGIINGTVGSYHKADSKLKEIVYKTTISTRAFGDVSSSAYYAAAVKWAVDKKITAGTSETTFSPDATCTRAQILTFLWRAVGSPKLGVDNPFTDVNSSDYFYDAALWAYKMGMVSGTTLNGSAPCTRSETVIYLWKNAGKSATVYNGNFTDVAADAEYAQAVAWAVNNKITSGTSETTFSPDATCTRGQIVTFLNRALNK